MAWDDLPPASSDSSITTSDWTNEPPSPEELKVASPPYSPMNPNEPGLQDVSIPDAMMAEGVGGLAKTGIGLGARGTGIVLNDVIPAISKYTEDVPIVRALIPNTKNIVPTIENTSNDLLLKGLGTRGMQIKGMGGLEKARDAADVAREAGMDKVFSTEIGRREALQDLIAKHGKEIGALRQEAGPANPEIYNQVKTALESKYNPSLADPLSSQYPNVEKGLNLVQNTAGPAPTHAGISQGITKLNDFATGAKQLQPVNAYTDVANQLSAANNAEIAQKLGSDKAADYLKALHNESGGFKLTQPFERGAERAAVGSGQGQGTLMALIQRIKDAGGYRAASKGLNALHGALAGPVDLSMLPPNALKAYLANQTEEEQP